MAIQRNVFEQIIQDNINGEYSTVLPREIELPTDMDRVITIAGARRSGKTSLMFHSIMILREQMPASRLLYINFEDDRLFGIDLADLDVLIETYYALYPENRQEKVYFFFDEIQRLPGWETFARRIHDTLNARIFVTGSSAALLGKEIATALRGRTLTYEVFPLAFSEYLLWTGLPAKPSTSEINAQIQKAFSQYISTTAFPELIQWRERERLMAIQEYIDLIVYRDVAERVKGINTEILKYLIRHVLVNAGNKISINGIYKDLKGLGLSVSKDSLYLYMGLLEDVFVLFTIPLYHRNLKVQQRNPKKLYLLDHGLKMAYSLGIDKGALLENIVFLALRRLFSNIFYWQGTREVDFIIQNKGNLRAINVCWDMSDATTREREVRGLLECLSEINLKDGLIITGYEEREIQQDNYIIKIVPAWKWLLEPQLN